jgi:hypothetical protein
MRHRISPPSVAALAWEPSHPITARMSNSAGRFHFYPPITVLQAVKIAWTSRTPGIQENHIRHPQIQAVIAILEVRPSVAPGNHRQPLSDLAARGLWASQRTRRLPRRQAATMAVFQRSHPDPLWHHVRPSKFTSTWPAVDLRSFDPSLERSERPRLVKVR